VGVAVSVDVATSVGVSVNFAIVTGAKLGAEGVETAEVWHARTENNRKSRKIFDFIMGILSKHHGCDKIKSTYSHGSYVLSLEKLNLGGIMDIFDVFPERHSIRSFTDQVITDDVLRRIYKAINRAPSAGNLQAFDIYQVTKTKHKQALMRASYDQEFLVQAPVVLVFCAVPVRSAMRYTERGKTLYCIQDATIACTFAMLAVTALGLGSVWVGAFDEEAVHKIISADPGHRPVAMLPIGYPNAEPRIRPRRALEEIVHKV